jgi:predicted ATP-dependent endonuclease of OLD family
MKLSNLIIVNYKSCKKVVINLFADAPTVLIGKNDCGKSTVLNAIGLLLSDKPKIPNLSDFSNTRCSEAEYQAVFTELGLPLLDYKEENCVIIGQFNIDENLLDEEKINDYSDQLLLSLKNPTQLAKDEGNKSVFLARRFYTSGLFETYIICKEVAEAEYKAAWSATAASLKIKTKALGINDADIQNENNKGALSNYERIRAIHDKLTCCDEWALYKQKPLDKSIFPEYRYLDWRASLEDINTLATDNLKATIEEHFSQVREQVESLVSDLENKLSDELRATFLSDIQGIATSISNIKAKITSPEVGAKISGIFLEKEFSDGDIHLDAQGEGIKRQIWFALIQHAAKQVVAKKSKQNFIWAFDEPETHLYPIAQRHLYDILKDVATGHIQVLISTHSTLFVDRVKLSHIAQVSLSSGYTTHAKCITVDEVFTSLGLRNSDFLFYDRFLIVEGATEQFLIPGLYKLHTGRSLQEDNIQLIQLGGTGKWEVTRKLLESALKDFGKAQEQIVWIFDNDFAKKVSAQYKTANVFFVGKQDIEDSISSEVWVNYINEAVQNQIETNEDVTLAELLIANPFEITFDVIEEFRESITTKTNAGSDDKFAHRLGKLVRGKLALIKNESINYPILPSKGEASSSLLLKHITSMDQVDTSLKKAFDLLKVTEVVPELKETAETLSITM